MTEPCHAEESERWEEGAEVEAWSAQESARCPDCGIELDVWSKHGNPPRCKVRIMGGKAEA